MEWLSNFFEDNPQLLVFDMVVLRKLVNLCVENAYFSFEGEYYLQVSGLPMGSCLSPVMANLFMELMELRFPEGLFGSETNYFRYVDDTLVVLDESADPITCMDRLNNIHENIKFTLEVEDVKEKSINFLDLKIYRRNGGWKFNVYRKQTHNNKYIHWLSFHDKNVKKGVLYGQIWRAYNTCDPEFLEDELIHIVTLFKKLAYPETFIKSVERSVKRRIYNPIQKEKGKEKERLVLPCPPTALFRSVVPGDINLVARQTHKLATHMFTKKYPTDKEVGIYKIPCEGCKSVYIGETDNFKRRIS
jgi:hypothetical protein